MTRTRTAGLAAAIAVAASVLLSPAAYANVNSGGGQTATTYTQCMSSTGVPYEYGPSFTAKTVVPQEFDGQLVAAKLWVYDARGWVGYDWRTATDPGWSPDGVTFVWQPEDLQPIAGHAVYLYVEYGWYDANGWRTGGELLTSYMTQGGVAMSYCYV